MGYLSIKLDSKAANGQIKHIHDALPSLTHLIYVDDILIFMKADINGVQAIKRVFQKLEIYVGLQSNTEKPRVMCSKEFAYKEEILSIPSLQEGELPIKYLSVPLSVQCIEDEMCNDLLDKIRKKIRRWECNLLTLAGRIELARTIIYPMIRFWT